MNYTWPLRVSNSNPSSAAHLVGKHPFPAPKTVSQQVARAKVLRLGPESSLLSEQEVVRGLEEEDQRQAIPSSASFSSILVRQSSRMRRSWRLSSVLGVVGAKRAPHLHPSTLTLSCRSSVSFRTQLLYRSTIPSRLSLLFLPPASGGQKSWFLVS